MSCIVIGALQCMPVGASHFNLLAFLGLKTKYNNVKEMVIVNVYSDLGLHLAISVTLNLYINIVTFSVEIILRAEAVEQAQAGDKCDFTGTLIVVPDVAQLNVPGMNSMQLSSKNKLS